MYYELHVELEYLKGYEDEYHVGLRAKTEKEAIVEAKRILMGDPEKWRGKWTENVWNKTMEFEFELDPEEDIARESGQCVFMDMGQPQQVCSAIIRKTETVRKIDLGALGKQIEEGRKRELKRCESDPEYKTYLKLKEKFGGR